MKILLLAELCNPGWVSVPQVGWNIYRTMAERHDVHLVTHRMNAENLEAAGLRPGHDFTAIDLTREEQVLGRVARRLRGEGDLGQTTKTATDVLAYYQFERRTWRALGSRVEAGEFDIVHRVTPITPAAPSPIAWLCDRAGVPFVLGPLNGGLPWPKGFGNVRRREREWLGYARDAFKLLPGYRSTRKRAAAIIGGSRPAVAELGARHRAKAVYIPENGIDTSRFSAPVEGPVRRPLPVCFAGRLVPLKGVDMLLDAVAPLVRREQVSLTIIGDGDLRSDLERQAKELGLEQGVAFTGWVEHDRLEQELRRHDVLAFPSIRDFGGAVVLEAMALGLAPVVVAFGGPGEMVTPQTGVAVELGTRDELVMGFRRALEDLAEQPDRVRALGAGARERVLGCFTWEAKADQIEAVYHWVLGQGPRPEGAPGAGRAP